MNTWNGHNKVVQEAMESLNGPESYDALYDALNHEFNTYYDKLTERSPLRAYIDYFVRDDMAILQDSVEEPVLYGTLLGDVECTYGSTLLKGATVRVTMVSKIGDIGITTNLTAPRGYNARVGLNALKEYRTTQISRKGFIYNGAPHDQPHHVIDTETGQVLENTEAESWSASVEKYREHYAYDRVYVIYEKGLDIVPIQKPKDWE